MPITPAIARPCLANPAAWSCRWAWASLSWSRGCGRTLRAGSTRAPLGSGCDNGEVRAPWPGSLVLCRTTSTGTYPVVSFTSRSIPPRRPPVRSRGSAGPQMYGVPACIAASVTRSRSAVRMSGPNGISMSCEPNSRASAFDTCRRCSVASALRCSPAGSGGALSTSRISGSCSRCTRRRQRVTTPASSCTWEVTGEGYAATATGVRATWVLLSIFCATGRRRLYCSP